MRIGLASFSLQCVLLAVADSPWHLFGCAFLAMAGNLVYPSVSSLVSSTVRPDMVGRALGAINGVKSVTEGIGPLIFGSLLTMSENDRLPGWPYFGAAIMVAVAYQVCRELPMEDGGTFNKIKSSRYNSSVDEEYICLMDNPRKQIDDDDDDGR
jgi:MFS family permease